LPAGQPYAAGHLQCRPHPLPPGRWAEPERAGVPTAAPWARVACRASPDECPHRPQPGSGHRPRRPEKPAGSVRRSSPLPSCVLQLAPPSPAQAATTTR